MSYCIILLLEWPYKNLLTLWLGILLQNLLDLFEVSLYTEYYEAGQGLF